MQHFFRFFFRNGYGFVLLSFVVVMALAQCSDRDRSNPLDPRNPATQGRPPQPSIVSFQDSVVLSWRLIPLSSVINYHVYRRLQNETTYQRIATVDANTSEFSENGVGADSVRFYRISASTASFESPLSDSVQIRPGPTYVWAIDFERSQVVKLTHDGDHEIFRAGSFIRPIDFAIDGNTGSATVIDNILTEASRFTGSGQPDGSFTIVRGATQAEIDPADGSLWIMERDSAAVTHYAKSGEPIVRITGFGEPVDMEFDPVSRHVWVLDRSRGAIYEVDDSNVLRRYSGFGSAFDLSLNSRDRTLWIADSNAISIASLEFPQVVRREGYIYAARVAVNEATGECWAVDWSERFGNSTLIKLSSQGERVFTLSGFVEPKSLAVNFSNGHCFVAEPDVRAFIEVDADGQIVSDTDLPGAFTKVLVQNVMQ